MDVSLIQPRTDGTDIEPPKGLASLAAYLDRAGHKVGLIDLQIEPVHSTWETTISSQPVDIVGLTAATPQIRSAHEIAQKVKSLRPGIPIVVGGVHASVMPEQTLREFPSFDLCAIGEGEATLLELVSRLEQGEPIADESVLGIAFRREGEIIVTPARPRLLDLDSLPDHHRFYDFEYYLENNTLGLGKGAASLIISRGCPYNCQFCAARNFWTNRYVCKTVDGALEEVQRVLVLGARNIKFRDSVFVINKKWVRNFCDRILEAGLRFSWSINARANTVDYDLFKHMKAAGLSSVWIGAESGSQQILDFYGKGISVDQTRKAFSICRELKINTGAYWMMGVLPETREDLEATYRLAKEIKADQNFVFLFMPLPGAELYQHYLEQGCDLEYDRIGWDNVAFPTASGYGREELQAIRRRWYEEFNEKPNVMIRGVKAALSVRTKEDFIALMDKVGRRLPGRIFRA